MIDYYAPERTYVDKLYLSAAIGVVAGFALVVCAIMFYRSRIAAAMGRRYAGGS